MAHSTNIQSAYNSSTGGYDFSDNYEYVTDYISSADIALCNMETTFEGTTPRGYPTFNAPDELAAAVKGAGFDVAITSNNHMMDSGFNGMQRTLEILRGQGMVTVGSRYEGEDSFAITEANGVKIGIVAYTYETTQAGDSGVTINGTRVDEASQKLINSFNYNELETTDYAKIQSDIDDAREAGAEIVICYFHWGEEYMREPTSYQLSMAQRAADMGADIIFASHPHVLQKVDVLTSSSGQSVPVFYSMGNFISNQREETLPSIANRKYTEQGMLACVDVEYMKGTGEILSETIKVIPTWVDRFNGSSSYRIIPLDDNLDSNPTLSTSGHLSRAKSALADVKALIGDTYLSGMTIHMGEQTGAEENDKAA
jgi:poly-gamma-glutamate synthesis protein (capsule biosynthesis protein)